ncbi:MAG TPA: DNA polymerase III subunit alpha, partial [Spirochaetia bacterium]|nr:DNA polymerase III subunit alpha [Spirochaetia bacterium]
MPDFVHLHTHSDSSLLDGAVSIENLIEKTHALGLPALAITDHGNMFAALEFYQTARDFSRDKNLSKPLKSIIGCEFYVAENSMHEKSSAAGEKYNNFHLIALAMNRTGYNNLMKLASAAFLEGFYRRPRIDFSLLSRHSEGLIIMSACVAGEIPLRLIEGNYNAAKKCAEKYLELFGRDRFYLELQDHGLENEKKANAGMLQLAKELDLSYAATNDIHYLDAEDSYVHEILLCINTGGLMSQPKGKGNGFRFAFDGTGFHYKTPEEMTRSFGELPLALSNTVRIAEMCELDLSVRDVHMPKFKIPEGYTADSWLKKISFEGLSRRKKEDAKYSERITYELSVIEKMGFAGYFLIVSDFINAAKNKNIYVGPGRGSAAGSLISYAIGITNIDPLCYDLLFERFLNPERVNMPDIDIDFQDDRREEVIDYIRNQYGDANISRIITYNRLKARAAFKDVARAFEVDYNAANDACKLIEKNPNLQEAYKNSQEFRSLIDSNEVMKKVYNYALKLEDLKRQTGIHAAGIIIADAPIDNYAPLFFDSEKKITATQYEGGVLEKGCGLVKIDCLGLTTLRVIKDTLAMIRENHKKDIDIETIPFDDLATYRLFAEGKTLGIFQFESAGMRKNLIDLKPTEINDLIAMNAMFRPGPMKWIPVYTAKKHGQIPKFDNNEDEKNYGIFEKIMKKIPCLNRILSPTYGIPIYQEQIMEIGKEYAGFSLGKADIMRRAMGKKDLDTLNAVKKDFAEGVKKCGFDPGEAEFIFEKIITPFSRYGFNKSHSACYAYVAYQAAWLKANFPVEFMAALLNSKIDDLKKIGEYIYEAKTLGLEVLPPDINRSALPFSTVSGKILFALAAIKGVGAAAGSVIIEERKNGLFKTFADFMARINLGKVNKQCAEHLIKAGVFSYTGFDAEQLLFLHGPLSEIAGKERDLRSAGQISLFDLGGPKNSRRDLTAVVEDAVSNKISEACEIKAPRELLKKYEYEVLGCNFRYNPLGNLEKVVSKISTRPFSERSEWKDGLELQAAGYIVEKREIRTREKNQPMAFITLENATGR